MERKSFNIWLDNLMSSDAAIIVEGPRDREALEKIGLTRIYILQGPLYKVVEGFPDSVKEVVILTDFDKKGKELYGKLCKECSRLGIKVDKHFREFLKNNSKISHIEGIGSLFK